MLHTDGVGDPTSPQSGGPPPGWYDDPWAPGQRRWWSGSEWTGQVWTPQAPAPTTPAVGAAQATAPPAPVRRPRWPWVMGGMAGAVVVAGVIGAVIAASAGVFDDSGGADDTGAGQPVTPTPTVPPPPSDSEPYESPHSHRIPEVGLGQAVSMKTQEGTRIRVTALSTVDPVPRGTYSLHPARGTRWVGVRMRLENRGPGRFKDAPANGARVMSRGREFRAVSAAPGACPELEAIVRLERGRQATGCLIFEVDRRSKRVDRLRYTPSSGFAPDVASWRLSG